MLQLTKRNDIIIKRGAQKIILIILLLWAVLDSYEIWKDIQSLSGKIFIL